MLKVDVMPSSVAKLKKTIADLGFNVRKELAVAVNATVKKCKFEASKELGKILPVPAKTLKKIVGQKRRADEARIEAIMILREGYEFSLRFFKPKQTAAGVTVVMDKRIKGKKGRTLIPSAFLLKFGGIEGMARKGPPTKMLRGRYKGKIREPIIKLMGPSPGQAIKDANIAKLVVYVAQQELQKKITERIRFLTLKASGQLRGKQK